MSNPPDTHFPALVKKDIRALAPTQKRVLDQQRDPPLLLNYKGIQNRQKEAIENRRKR